MSPKAALGAALRDMYHQSWRLVLLNALLSAYVVPVAIGGLWVPPVWVLLLGAGPLAAALMHCAVVVTLAGEFRFGDALDGLRRHWRRGLGLGVVFAAVAFFGVYAISFYAGRVLVLAVLAGYLLLAFGVFQLVLWPLAIFELRRPIRSVVEDSARIVLARPLQALALGLVLLVVNIAGAAAAAMPFLTMTVAYSFLAAARFALPGDSTEDEPWPR